VLDVWAISVVPLMIAVIPTPLPPPVTETRLSGCFLLKASAAFWEMGKTVSDPFTLMASVSESLEDSEELQAEKTNKLSVIKRRLLKVVFFIFFFLYCGKSILQILRKNEVVVTFWLSIF